MNYIKTAAVKKIAKANGRRVGKDFLAALDNFIARKTELAAKTKNGSKVTMDADLAAYCGIK